jgi:hypothetical protein
LAGKLDFMNVELRDNPLKGIELGPKLQACNEKERIFVFSLATGVAKSATQAVQMAGYSQAPASAKVLGSRLLHRPRIVEAIEEVCRTQFRNLIPRVIEAARQVLEDPKHPDHVKLLTSLLSRLGYGEKALVDVNVTGEIAVDHTTAAIEDLRRLKAIGVPREKLLEVFGFSGLSRYEAMLAERDARAPKTIEHKRDEAAGSVDQHHNPMDAP